MDFKNKIVFIFAFVFLIISAKAFAFEGDGSGTEEDPYQISTCQQLQSVTGTTTEMYVYYQLIQDVDCSDTINWNGGLGFEPIGTAAEPLTGNPYVIGSGGAHKIINLYINRPLQDYVGIFGYTTGDAGFDSVGLVNPVIVGHDYVGTFRGYSTSTEAFQPVNYRTYVNGGSVTGNSYVGGLIGYGYDQYIGESYSNAIVTGNSFTGGVIGAIEGSSANIQPGVYYDSERSGQSDSDKGEPKTHLEMLTQSSYSTAYLWDFENVWGMVDGETYPYLGVLEIAATLPELPIEDGTEEHPFLISSCAELQDMNNNITAHYKLTQNIDCSDTINWNGGLGFEPIALGDLFIGSLDGDNYSINNLYINRVDDSNIGLFSVLASAHVYDLNIYNADITGGSYVGILSGRTFINIPDISNSIISNVSVSGDVYVENAEVGGLIGRAEYTIISDSSAAIHITTGQYGESIGGLVGYLHDADLLKSYATGTISTPEGNRLGGVVGTSENGSIVNSYALVDITANGVYGAVAGGLVGWLDSADLENSYSAGRITGGSGGLVGLIANSNIISSYYDSQTSGQSDTDKGEPKTTAQMKNSATFIDWDFNTVWGINESITYPYLNNPGTTGSQPVVEEQRPRKSRSGRSMLVSGSPVHGSEVDTIKINNDNNGGGAITVESSKKYLMAIAKSFTRNLYLGLEGDDVKMLQYFLVSKNTGPASVALAQVGATGYFGSLTQQALVEFQKSQHISPAVGYFGTITSTIVSKLIGIENNTLAENPVRDLKLGLSGQDVKSLQNFLILKNTGPASVALAQVGATGYFGSLTQQALIEYQKEQGIIDELGFVGIKTRELIK